MEESLDQFEELLEDDNSTKIALTPEDSRVYEMSLDQGEIRFKQINDRLVKVIKMFNFITMLFVVLATIELIVVCAVPKEILTKDFVWLVTISIPTLLILTLAYLKSLNDIVISALISFILFGVSCFITGLSLDFIEHLG